MVNKITKVLHRDLTVRRKATVVNVIALSKLWYSVSMSKPPDDIVVQVDTAIAAFLRAKRVLHLIKHARCFTYTRYSMGEQMSLMCNKV